MQELPQKNRVAKIKTGPINGAILYFYMEKNLHDIKVENQKCLTNMQKHHGKEIKLA